jgi:hypothetical protein
MDLEKSMKHTNKMRTICEVVREVNDALNTISDKRRLKNTIRIKIEEIHNMAKRMSKKLYEYSKKWDADFWEANNDYGEAVERRRN